MNGNITRNRPIMNKGLETAKYKQAKNVFDL